MRVGTYAAGCESMQSEHMLHFFRGCCASDVDLVAEEEDGSLRHLFVLEKTLQLAPRLVEAVARVAVDEEDDAVDNREVVLPHPPCLK